MGIGFGIIQPASVEPETICEWEKVSGAIFTGRPVKQVCLLSETRTENSLLLEPTLKMVIPAPHQFAFIFHSAYTVKQWLASRDQIELVLKVIYDDASYDLVKLSMPSFKYKAEKARKLERFAHLLACPYCHLALERNLLEFRCPACRRTYLHNGNAVDFLTPEFKIKYSIIPTSNVSSHGYGEDYRDILAKNPGKLFLDCGAGMQRACFSNLLNMEIVNYASTDVLGVGEELPFLDNSLDGVFSIVVLEHVKDPFRCASEIMRVLKPGGLLFCEVPFLQPVHAYPNHYYNMTSQGLINLFPDLNVERLEVPLHLHPMAAITWILNAYFLGLPPEQQERFLSLKVMEVIEQFRGIKAMKEDPMIRQLSQEIRAVIACGNRLVGTKK